MVHQRKDRQASIPSRVPGKFLKGPQILKSEIAACCIDNISTEMLKSLGVFGFEKVTESCNLMYGTAHIPAGLKTSVFILPPKKPKGLLNLVM